MLRPFFVTCLILVLLDSASAQMNADRKEVKRRKIKTVTALNIKGDTMLTRFTYDTEGRLIGWYQQYGIMQNYTSYDERGNKTSSVEILPPDTGAQQYVRADTVSKKITRYNAVTNEISYQLTVEYGNNTPYRMEIQKGDTVFYYFFPHGTPVLEGMQITAKIDSLKRTVSEIFYSIVYHDSLYSSLRCDTIFEVCNVTVFDRHGNPIEQSHANVSGGAKPENGNLYTPIGKQGTELIVFAVITNEYAWNGSLRSITRKGPAAGSTTFTQWSYPKHEFYSLKEIESRGTVTYTYHN